MTFDDGILGWGRGRSIYTNHVIVLALERQKVKGSYKKVELVDYC